MSKHILRFCYIYLEYLTIIFQISSNKPENEAIKDSEKNEDVVENDFDLLDNDNDDGENVISLNKIKSSVNLEDDQKSRSDAGSEKLSYSTKAFMPNVKLQSPFQPGSTPSHLLSYFMVQYNNNAYIFMYTLIIISTELNLVFVRRL